MSQLPSRRRFLACAQIGLWPPATGAINRLTPQERAARWRLLFDGRSLRGWEDPARESPPGHAWVVEDGCLKAVARPRIREDLLTTESFGDFELVFEWRISPRGNSGVKYRIQDRALLVRNRPSPAGPQFEAMVNYELTHRRGDRSKIGPEDEIEEYLVAFEYQVIDAAVAAGARSGPGSLYDLAGEPHRAERPVGEFNQGRILLRGNHVEHWLNGVKVVDVDLDSAEVLERLERRWGKGSPVYELLTRQERRRTPIALQHHNDEAWFRNIKLRPL
jgi:hypothetical protein